MGERRLSGQDQVDLLQLNEMRPVGDDPVAAGVLRQHRCDQVLVEFSGIDLRVREAVDQCPLVCRRSRQQLFELVPSVDELPGGQRGRHRSDSTRVVFLDPAAVLEGGEHLTSPLGGLR